MSRTTHQSGTNSTGNLAKTDRYLRVTKYALGVSFAAQLVTVTIYLWRSFH